MLKNITTRNTEVVLKGHPDRMCDQIAKIIAELIYQKDKDNGRSACELLYNGDHLIIAGEYKTSFSREELEQKFEEIANECISKQTKDLPKITQIWHTQSPEINKASQQGFGDNTIAYGYYNHTTGKNKTVEHAYLEGKAEWVEKNHSKQWPDGKIILINNELSISIEEGISKTLLKHAGFKHITIFEKSGGFADTGLVGRKLIAEGPGAGIPHGGGAKCGKDNTKGDRFLKTLGDHIARSIGKRDKRDVLVQLSCVFGSKKLNVIDVSNHNKPVELKIGSFTELKDISENNVFVVSNEEKGVE